MSWRAESTFVKASALTEDEKEWLKVAKKIREILKLEERAKKGETLDKSQSEKVGSIDKLLKEVTKLSERLPGSTELLGKNPDITDLLPKGIQQSVQKKAVQDSQRSQRREQQEREEREKPEFMCRHDRPILGMAVAKQENFIFTCSKDKYVICWSMKEKLLVSLVTFAGHTGAVFGIDYAPAVQGNPARLLTGGADGKVMLWKGDAARSLRLGSVASPMGTLEHGGNLRVVKWCPFDAPGGPQRFATASEKLGKTEPIIGVWSVAPGSWNPKEVLRLTEIPGKANDLRWGSGAKVKLFSAHDNGYIGVWSAEAGGSLLKTIKVHAKPISSICLTDDGKTLLTASHDSSSCAVDVSTKETPTLATYKADRPLNAIACSSDYVAGGGGMLFVGGGRATRDVTTSKIMEDEFEVKCLDSESGVPVAAGKGHFGPVHRLLFIPWIGKDGGVASASEDGNMLIHGSDGRVLHSDVIGGGEE